MSTNAALDRFNHELDAADNGLTVRNAAVDSYRPAGIEGDINHAGEGYHTWWILLSSPFDYSGGNPGGRNTAPRDARGNPKQACATDIAFDAADMVIVSVRLEAAVKRNDPRLAGIREINMWLGGPRPVNRDQVLDWRENYPPSSSHFTHIHIAGFRDTADDWATWSGVLEIITGSTHQEVDEMATPEAMQLLRGAYNFAKYSRDRLAAMTNGKDNPNGRKSLYVVDPATKRARYVDPGTPGAKVVQLADTLDLNTIVLAVREVAAMVGANTAQLDEIQQAIVNAPDATPELQAAIEADTSGYIGAEDAPAPAVAP